MQTENYSYNPNSFYNTKPSWFRGFIMLQDEIPSNMVEKKEDSLFLKHCIVQRKMERPKSFSKSVFTSHLLKNSGSRIKEKEILNYGWVTGIIAICFIFYAIANYGYFRRMQQIFKAFFAKRLFNQFSREEYLVKRFLFFYSVLLF